MWAKIVIPSILAVFLVGVMADLSQEGIDDVCLAVGALSGCSGCEHGTNGLCKYLRAKETIGVYSHSCVPTSVFNNLVNGRGSLFRKGVYSSGAFLCSSIDGESTLSYDFVTDPNVSPPLDRKKRDIAGSSVPAKQASTAFSATVKSDKTTVPTGRATVDRTSSMQALGSMRKTVHGGFKRDVGQTSNQNVADLTCENFNSAQLTTVAEQYDGCNVGAGYYGPLQQVCKTVNHEIWAKFLCPVWGVAFSGFCETFANQAILACHTAGCASTFPWDIFQPSFSLIRSDNSKFCVSDVIDVPISGSYAAAVGFHSSSTTLNPVSAMVGTFVLGVNVTTINDARKVLKDPLLQIASSTRLYEILDFDRPDFVIVAKRLVTKPPPGPPGGTYITLGNGTVYLETIEPYLTPWADQLTSLPNGAVAYQITGLLNIPTAGFYSLNIAAEGQGQVRINGSVFGSPDTLLTKRSTSSVIDNRDLEFASGWVPFEVTGFFTDPYSAGITFSAGSNSLFVGDPSGQAVRTFSLDTPVHAAVSLAWYCDGCTPPGRGVG